MLGITGCSSKLRLWTGEQSLVTTRTYARMSGFDMARTLSANAGWPVFVRGSGGTTVVHRAGILNVSLFKVTEGTGPTIDDAYEDLIELLIIAHAQLGLEAYTGRVRGSYCDGRYNLCVGGRKIAGTSCQVRHGCFKHVQLAHASIVVEGEIMHDLDAISRFENALGIFNEYDPESHRTVASALKELSDDRGQTYAGGSQ